MKADHTFTPHILALDQPITFAPLLDFRSTMSRKPAADMLASPWHQYASRVMAMYYSDGVDEDMLSWFARALGEAYAMGQHGMEPAAPGQKRPAYRTVGEKVAEVHAEVVPGKRVSRIPETAEEAATAAAAPRIARRSAPRAVSTRIAEAAPAAPAPAPIKRITRRT